MINRKRIFCTPKKAVISIICIAIVVLILIVAIRTIVTRNSLISRAEARDIALRDAGLNDSEALNLREKLAFDDGRFQYEVDFFHNDIEYEYVIQAKNGDILERDSEGDRYKYDLGENPSSNPEDLSVSDRKDSAQSLEISLDKAKEKALSDANLSEEEVTFTKAGLDDDGRMKVYDIEFYTSDREYDYEINAYDGTVHEKAVEEFHIQPGDFAENDAGNSGSRYIGIDQAKMIALNHANFHEGDVQFAKAKLENDDGIAEYEIEFYFKEVEYSYNVDAVSGDILEYDVDFD